jgi:hypothetical protein
MTGVWLNSFIRLMWKVLLWQGCGLLALLGQCEKGYNDTVIVKQQFISINLLWQKNNTIAGKIYNITVLTVNIELMWRGLDTGERRVFSESFHPFRAEPHTFYIYRQYNNIVFILQ